jgi:hypothetical protein
LPSVLPGRVVRRHKGQTWSSPLQTAARALQHNSARRKLAKPFLTGAPSPSFVIEAVAGSATVAEPMPDGRGQAGIVGGSLSFGGGGGGAPMDALPLVAAGRSSQPAFGGLSVHDGDVHDDVVTFGDGPGGAIDDEEEEMWVHQDSNDSSFEVGPVC